MNKASVPIVVIGMWALLGAQTGAGQDASPEWPFAFPDRGGMTWTTAGAGAPSPGITYVRIRAIGGAPVPSGFGIFGLEDAEGDVLTETSVPAMAPIQSGRTFVLYGGDATNTGLAILNPNDEETTIDFFFTDTLSGREAPDFGHDFFTLRPGQQIARFVSEEPFNLEEGSQGTLTFSSTLPVAAIALTQFVNARGEQLYNTLPVTDLSAPLSTDTVFLPHFAIGGAWRTDFILINPTDETITGRLILVSTGALHPQNPLWDDPGLSTSVSLNGSFSQPAYAYAIGPRSYWIFRSTPGFAALKTGSARVVPTPDDGSVAPIVHTVFSSGQLSDFNFQALSRSSFDSVTSGLAFRTYVETRGGMEEAGAVRSGIAVHNIDFDHADVAAELTDLAGNLVVTGEIPVPPSGQRALFVDEIFPDFELPDPFQGVLRVATADQQIAVIGLRSRRNSAGEFQLITTPPNKEAVVSGLSEAFFPHLVDGGGWTTETILFSGSQAGAAEGVLQFFGVDGEPFPIPLQ